MRSKRVLFLIVLDIISIYLAYTISIFLLFSGQTASREMGLYYLNFVPNIPVKLLIFYFFNLYKSLWEYASVDELLEVIFGTITANIAVGILMYITDQPMLLSLLIIITLNELILIGGTRFLYRVFRRVKSRLFSRKSGTRTLIVGAGAAGVMILKELRNHNGFRSIPVAFIDDDIKKQGSVINGIPVVGTRNDIERAISKYDIDEVIISIPSAKVRDKNEILHICKNAKVKTRILPGMYELIGGQVSVSQIRDVQIEDLLGRDEVNLNTDELSSFIDSKVIMVTGGGGSIGSELCRQIAKYNPRELIILDIYENNLYDIQQELSRHYKNLNIRPIIASVRDKLRIDEIVEKVKPDIIFHAAAHKHVPLMEGNPQAAIKNNVFGTLNVAEAADKYKVSKFVLISTDKAVNPTNVMGATKRLAEIIIQTYNSISSTDFVAVRFGNVLGSNGSVIPLFKKQIAEGGPVTVTDERIIRYFMTIPEACNLVLEAGAMATGGEIFVLDMGQPVKVIDLARDLIRLSGFEPDVDIPIEIIGLRPGEKLYEEILIDTENMKKTKNNKIFIEEPMEFSYDALMDELKKLKESLFKDDIMELKYKLADLIPTYKPYFEGHQSDDINIAEDVEESSADKLLLVDSL